jgi:hypothetical protein
VREEDVVQHKGRAIALVCVLVAAVTVIVVQGREGPAGAQDLAPATIASGFLQFDSDGPTRIFDSRTGFGEGAPAAPLAPTGPHSGHTIYTPPAPQGATAVMVNLTIVVDQPGSQGYAAAKGSALNQTSTVNWSDIGVYTNFALVPVTTVSKPSFILRIEGNNAVHVIVDLAGWVVPVA